MGIGIGVRVRAAAATAAVVRSSASVEVDIGHDVRLASVVPYEAVGGHVLAQGRLLIAG